MQTPTIRSAASAPTRKSNSSTSNSNMNNSSKNKKKKASQPTKSSSDNKDAAASVGPRPVVPPPVSGPWGNPKTIPSSAPPPGFGISPSPSTSSGFSDTHVRLLRHRALFAFRFLVGKAVELQLVDSKERFAGILDCIDPNDFSIVLKGTKRLSSSADAKPFEDGKTAIFRRNQLAYLVADGSVNYTDGVFTSSASPESSGFRTDTEISRQKGEHLYGRKLETASSWLDPALDTGALEDSESHSRRKSSGKAGWNQFEANEKLFGVVSTYDENIYTTKLDKSKISNEQSRAAEKLAQEIERQSAAGNFHLQEERGQTAQSNNHANDLDEEARYSSVDRRGGLTNEKVYVPPALRNTKSQSTVAKPPEKVAHTEGSADKSTPSALDVPVTTSPVAAAVHKPLSFSEAVTGRSATASTLKKNNPGEKSELTAVSNETQEDGKNKKSLDDVNESSNKQEVQQKTTENEDKSSVTTSTNTKEAPNTAPKKGLNPNAKEFRLNASATPFTPNFAVPSAVKQHVSSPYRGGSPHQMPYMHPSVAYSPLVQEEWMYDGLNGEEGGEMGMPPYGYGIPMGPHGVPLLYPPMIPQQNMRIMSAQTGGYGYQPHNYNPRGYFSPPNSSFSPYTGGTLVSPPLPPSDNKILTEDAADDALASNEPTMSDVHGAPLEPSSGLKK
ncbi:Protein interacting with poly(A)-binding protein [Plasmopara halstedii]|uniref:Protein interacting with poly(A)-binding protein n=1 Tax=Plasmopara halstedii TaxID=4781 RepID=A0A0P1A9Y5_PLAHL|nr:Protein interacting with poly(A)-binding protein [Plasmopara halstedii]CEG37151.1 Protein interacting with poly(A)-binding protein [Plasmopara halstedii]|eukprot:XP_024573520.1 Protein interacting with poly(A)-binding protein [Plasmopara halstedii]